MLISFTVSNFCSFKDPIEFTMIPSKEKIHRDWHLFSPQGTPHKELLRAAVLYGANSSGKSNFIKAFEFATRLVTKGVRPNRGIGNPTFKLDATCRKQPSCFSFEIQTREKMYLYEFQLSNDGVVFEKLAELTKSSEKIAYVRHLINDESVFEFGTVIEKQSREIQDNFKFLANGTRKNQLFLTDTIDRNIDMFRQVYNWFSDSIKIFTPTSIGSGVEFRLGNDEKFTDFLRVLLSEFDPSISNIVSKTYSVDQVKNLPTRILQEIESEIDEDGAIFLADVSNGNRLVVTKKAGELKILKMSIERKFQNSEEFVTFDLEEESDGTRRLIDLAPLFYELLYSEDVVVAFVDELDRSLHPLATKKLLELYLRISSQTNSMSQIIISTHNSVLFDQDLLRRDEIWLMDKVNGASKMVSLQRVFSPRYDKDIRKDYLEGQYGGIPAIREKELYDFVFKKKSK